MAKYPEYRERIASQLGVQFGNKAHNRSLTSAQCGQVGGMMVKEALRQVGFTQK